MECSLGIKNKKIRIAFYKGPMNWRTWIVNWRTGGPYTHCELIMPSGDCIGISPEDSPPRIRMKRQEFPDDNWDFIDIMVDQIQIIKIIAFFNSTYGHRYDWFGMIMSYLLPWFIKHERKWYCSQWIATLLTVSDVYSFNYIKMSPTKLYDILSMKVNNGLIDGSVEDA